MKARELLFQPNAGASGDMLLGAGLSLLRSAGEHSLVQQWVARMQPFLRLEHGGRMEMSDVARGPYAAVKIDFMLHDDHADGPAADHHHAPRVDSEPKPAHHHHHHHHRMFRDIMGLVDRFEADQRFQAAEANLARRILTALGEAEAEAHECELEQVHFHEVGEFDSLMDVFGIAILYSSIEAAEVLSTPVVTGSGKIHTAHGELSVPPPAVAAVLRKHKLPVSSRRLEGECLTPTGAAALSVLVKRWVTEAPTWAPASRGFGAGTRNPQDYANALELWASS